MANSMADHNQEKVEHLVDRLQDRISVLDKQFASNKKNLINNAEVKIALQTYKISFINS